MTRVLLVVNAFALLTVLLRNQSSTLLGQELVEMAGVMVFPLIFSLLLVYLCAPFIQKQTYSRAALIVAALAIVCLVVSFPVVSSFDIQLDPVRWMIWTCAAVALTMAYFHWRASAAASAVAEARMQALNARMRPHFFFNSINGVLGVMRTDPKQAEKALEALSDLFRALMQENRKLVPLRDEIDLCQRYLELEFMRLGERLEVIWDVDQTLLDALVPPLMLQPLVENAVYHGVEPSMQVGTVDIRIGADGRELLLAITNPLCAEPSRHPGNRMAQANIRERLALFYDIEARMDHGLKDGRYVVEIRLPIKRESAEWIRSLY
ncbi:MAG: histidine kinase [Betaproteobacteria bacterium]|nr:histidine kinase [Betaproteobacteria bacterium]